VAAKTRRTVDPDLRVAVVVPTRNSAATLAACLDSIRRQTAQCTIVVVDNRSTDASVRIAQERADIVLTGGPERSAQRNQGARATEARVIGFIDSDMVLPPSTVAEVLDGLTPGVSALVVPERTVGSGFWARVRAYERSFYVGSAAIEAARFFRREYFDAVGGFDEELTGPEDWDITMRVAHLGRIGRIDAVIDHDEGHISLLSCCAQKAHYSIGLRRFVRKHGRAGLGRTLERPYLRRPWTLFHRPILGLGVVTLKAAELTAVTLAWILFSRAGRS
jgi:glycosyltransferase involved in cell wall biosynthesis